MNLHSPLESSYLWDRRLACHVYRASRIRSDSGLRCGHVASETGCLFVSTVCMSLCKYVSVYICLHVSMSPCIHVSVYLCLFLLHNGRKVFRDVSGEWSAIVTSSLSPADSYPDPSACRHECKQNGSKFHSTTFLARQQ